MGHAINKILKDVILRYKILDGRKVHYVPGWDCHGLPIELKALHNTGQLDPVQIRTKAREFAAKTINEQKRVFQSWGVLGDWENAYATYNVDYVKNQVKQFYKLYSKGYIFRDVKPIYWSPSSRTALAESELEYTNHKSPSAYLRLKIAHIPSLTQFKGHKIYALVWTTTPWTLPSNQAVCYNKDFTYCFIKKPDPNDKDIYIVSTQLLEEVIKETGCDFQLLGVCSGDLLSDAVYIHPVYKDKKCRFYHATHVTNTKGTGLVHTAPAHGPEDFLVALENKLPIIDLVDETGYYTEEAGPQLYGKYVLEEGSKVVLDAIREDLVSLGELTHSYPYDWRTKKPVIIRASKQWFIDTNKIKSQAIELLSDVNVIPNEVYKNTFVGQLEKRPYWCISRQRKWGVPIPVFYKKNSNEVIINNETVDHICSLLDKHGTDFWWSLGLQELLPPGIHSDDVEKAEDILDIWFDSGISWSIVLDDKVADLYLEGLDQFNGWFQSSLITSVALKDRAPYKSIYVHGFAVDEKGNKMSKSLGNVVDPFDVTQGNKSQKPFGVDVLRWWVACHANQDQLAFVSHNVLKNTSDEVNKIRNVLRFAVGALSDYDGSNKDLNLLLVDRYMLHLLYVYHKQVQKHIDNYNFHRISKAIINLSTNQISALYYTCIKDRLYCDIQDSNSRRSAQYVLHCIYDTLTNSIAGIVPHLVEELHIYMPLKEKKTYFESKRIIPSENWYNPELENLFNIIIDMKKELNKVLLNNTEDSSVRIYCSTNIVEIAKNVLPMQALENQLSDILQVSKVNLCENSDIESFKLHIEKTTNHLCHRCRKFNSQKQDELCNRCSDVVDKFLENNKSALTS